MSNENANAAPASRKVLDVPRVGFYNGGNTGPEDFPFPSCLAAALDAAGQPIEWTEFVAPDKVWRNNHTNKRLLAATGMGFSILWRKSEPCFSSSDLTLINDHDETIRRAFAYVGREFEIVKTESAEQTALFARIRKSIDDGVPVVAFGIVGPPEACLVTGYDSEDLALVGWTFFPDDAGGDLEPNGMFRKTDWIKTAWKFVFIGERTEPTLTDEQVVRDGADFLRRTENAGEAYHAGTAAFDAWREFVEAPLPDPDDEKSCRQRCEMHHMSVGTIAEARCYAGDYLRHLADSFDGVVERKDYAYGLRQAAAMFATEHDLMWDAWNTLGGNGSPDAWKEFRDPAKRARLAAIIADAQRLDRLALRYLDRAIAGKQNWQE